MYVDGIAVDSTMSYDRSEKPLTISRNYLAAPLHEADVLVGCSRASTNPANWFQGRLDEVTVYDYMLSENDIEDLADVGAPSHAIINSIMF